MLKGRIGNTSNAPHLEGHLLLSGLKIRGQVSFLVDTGADSGIIMPEDGLRLGIPYKKLTFNRDCTGIGGSIKICELRALLTFMEPRRTFTYQVKIGIAPLQRDILDAPSLLGRDVINRMRMIYQHSNATVNFKVISADATAPI
jgi:hypothetical protein